jgi:hypothetical protein
MVPRMKRQGRTHVVPAVILVAAALTGVGAGALTPKSGDDAPAATASPPEPDGLFYYADGIIYDDNVQRQHLLAPGQRVAELTRTSVGWAYQIEWGVGRGRLVLQRGDRAYAELPIGSDQFDVSYDGTEVAYPHGDRVDVISSATGKRIDTVDPRLSDVDAVFFSDDNLIIAGTNADGASRVMLWAATRRQAYRLPLNVRDGFTTLSDVSAAGGYLVLTVDQAGLPCVAVLQLSSDAPAWVDADCEQQVYDDALSPEARYLISYPSTATPAHPGTVTVRDLDHPQSTTIIGDGDVVDAGWIDDRHLLIAEEVSTEPPAYALSYCTVDGACEPVGGNHGDVIAIGRVD